MAINYGPYSAVLDATGVVQLVIRAGPDPVVSANAALFRGDGATPPQYQVVCTNPFWTNPKATSNVLPRITQDLPPCVPPPRDPPPLAQCRLMVVVSMAVLNPDPNPNHLYTASISIVQNGQEKLLAGNNNTAGALAVELTSADLGKWHTFGIDFR